MIALMTSPGSPFGRKPRMAIVALGLGDRVAVTPSRTSNPDDPIHAHNPLRKMPVLVDADGMAIYDSPVIMDYLDWLAGGGRIIPTAPKARFEALTLQALADGLTEAVIAVRYEDRWHDEAQRSTAWIAHQMKKIHGALAALDSAPPIVDAPLNVGQIALACGLDYLDGADLLPWKGEAPRLAGWLADFAARTPAFAATKA